MTIGEKLRLIRTESGLTQGDIAAHVGCTQSIISDYEHDNSEPTYSKLTKYNELAKMYKVKVSLL